MGAGAFFNVDSLSPFGNNAGYNSAAPWTSNSNWNPMATSAQYSPANDAKNMSRFGARPNSLQAHRQGPRFKMANNMRAAPNQVQPSNWLQDTDFSKTLEKIKNTGSKTFFVNEAPMRFESGYQQAQGQSKGATKGLVWQYSKAENAYNNQDYGLPPAAASTPRAQID